GGITLTATGSPSSVAGLLTSDPTDNAMQSPGQSTGVLRSASNFTFGANCSLEAWIKTTTLGNNDGCCGAWNGSGSMIYAPGGTQISFYTGGAGLAVAATNG